MHLQRIFTSMVCIFFLLPISCDRNRKEYNQEEAIRRVLTVQRLQNLNPGDPSVVPQIESIVDSMKVSGKDACYFGAVNVLIDRLFSDGRYAEADSLAVRMQYDADEEKDSLAMAMAKRVRAQILYKLSQSDRALQEALSALPYVTDNLSSGSNFGTATSLNEWIHIIAKANSDTAEMQKAADRYGDLVRNMVKQNLWKDSTNHYLVTALAFEAENRLNEKNLAEANILLDSASSMMRKEIPARAYEHFFDTRCRTRAAEGNFSGALADVDTLLNTHACFPWFYLRDLQLKAEVENMAGYHEDSAKSYSQYIAYHDSLSTQLTDRRLHDLSVLYRSELDKEENRTATIRLLGLGSVTLLLLILLGVTLRHALAEKKRNRLLVERLHEYDRAEQSLLQNIPEDVQSTEDYSEIMRLDRHMLTERPYTNPGLGRAELASFLGISQEVLGQIIRSERDCTVHSYINSFRTEEARRILDSDSTETIAEIAIKLGFGTPRTFQRSFKERFDMTPTQYRAAASEIRTSENH